MTTVLVIDDERDLLELVEYNLAREHFNVITARDGASGFDIACRHRPDLIILDLMMPHVDGLEVCRRLRADERTRLIPLIMLTAKASEADRVAGLELGADDYVTKPFSPRELVARVRAVLRRGTRAEPEEPILRQGKLQLDVAARQATYDAQPVALTATEFRILQYLMSRPGRVLSRDEIINTALGQDAAVTDRAVDVHITALRRKLANGGRMIETVRGFGYRLRNESEAST